jgi:Glyoxalase-like domain
VRWPWLTWWRQIIPLTARADEFARSTISRCRGFLTWTGIGAVFEVSTFSVQRLQFKVSIILAGVLIMLWQSPVQPEGCNRRQWHSCDSHSRSENTRFFFGFARFPRVHSLVPAHSCILGTLCLRVGVERSLESIAPGLGTAGYGGLKMKIGSIVVRCYEFDKMLAFWREALHYVPREPSDGSWVVLREPEGRGPNVSLDRVSERHSGKRSRLHFDLYTNNREAEVQRLIKRGATRY